MEKTIDVSILINNIDKSTPSDPNLILTCLMKLNDKITEQDCIIKQLNKENLALNREVINTVDEIRILKNNKNNDKLLYKSKCDEFNNELVLLKNSLKKFKESETSKNDQIIKLNYQLKQYQMNDLFHKDQNHMK